MVIGRGLGLRYAITGLSTASSAQGFDGATARWLRLQAQVRRWALDAVDFVQLREKTLDPGEVFALARVALEAIASVPGSQTRLLVNGRPDIAAAAGAHGVQLTARPGELRPAQVRKIFELAGLSQAVVGVSCHTVEEVQGTRQDGADLVLFGPVFEKRVGGELLTEGTGLELLRRACAAAGAVPVLALGGVSEKNAAMCVDAGAAGIAGIRSFG